MYLTHYNIETKPFEPNPDPKFIWLGERHKEVLAGLKYGIQENKGFILLTGDIGTGKTILINCFLNENNTDSHLMSIPDFDLGIEDFFRLLADEFGFNIDFETRGQFLLKFKNCLDTTYSDRKKVLLIIDEAQRLKPQILEQIRLLATIEIRDLKLFSITLVGHNDLHQCLMAAKKRGLPPRDTIHCHVEPLTETETHDYINHRLQVAGSQKEIFCPEAISEIFSFSKGCPRLINTICDRTLLTGYALGRSQIDCEIVQTCADDLALPAESGYALETAQEKPDAEITKNNKREASEEKVEADPKKEQFNEASEKKPVTAVIKENNREPAAGAYGAATDSDTNRDAAVQKPEASAGEYMPFTWGPGAEPEALRVSVNDRELPSHHILIPATRIMVAAVAILILMTIVLYIWLGA